jgi:cytochrome c6
MKRVAHALIALSVAATGAVFAADINSGRQVYNLHCASCHGPSGMSVMPNAPNIARGAALMQADAAIAASIRNGRNAMPAYVGILKDQAILDVIAYMRTFRQ